ncbi:single-stranded-DNA-specific exonuclease RecJ [Acidicapsa acidisoli]|uniref:single-stranded-DNA-specific exonuclease RecJ n=1 Tax=Acidicapsa acidisoli TaxID=1615681 RepID=UPI0021E0B32B|nr:single-stranded-DNA-specific exonuclease RecJ [Acidicapsa acidisoli]
MNTRLKSTFAPNAAGAAGVTAEPVFTPPPQRWQLSIPHPEEAASLASEARIPVVVAELLIARGITTPEAAYNFLNPEISQLHDPFLMLGMAAAVDRLELAIARCETILLYGDYDVDGTTAVVLLKTAIEMLSGANETNGTSGARVRFHVPHRLREGYGIQTSVLEAASRDGVGLVISVDTGMRAFAEARRARELGLDLIITDHHLPDAEDEIPVAVALLNPNQPGCPYPEKSLCGAAIAFKLAQAILQRHDERNGLSRTREKTIPSFLKMVAIATIADAVPLRGENRVLAALGIRELHRPAGLGLRALFQAAGIDPAAKQLTSFDLGFRLGPRINAAGRMDIAAEVVELFTTRDAARAHELANKLERLNTERRETEAEVLRKVEARLATDQQLAANRMLVMAGEGWHRGIIGILASRIVDRTAKPAIVVSVEDGVAYGSGRSIDGFPLLEAIETCADLYTRFGGHAFAVGFAMPAKNLAEMERRLCAFAAQKLAGRDAEQILRIHAELPLDRVTPVLAGWLRKLDPLGHGNPEPAFVARNLQLTTPVRLMKEKHIRLEVAPALTPSTTAAQIKLAPMKAVGWNMARRASELALEQGSVIDLAYRIRENDHPQYGGLQIEIAGIEAVRTG